LSKDFYWYSPILKAQLEDKRGDVAIRPGSVAELRVAISLWVEARVPIVPREAGTGINSCPWRETILPSARFHSRNRTGRSMAVCRTIRLT
jgi:hypothetical protein